MPPPELPEAEVTRLHQLQASRELPALRLRVRLLREAGWTLQAIASALSTYRSTVRAWQVHPSSALTSEVSVPQAPQIESDVPLLRVDPRDYPRKHLPLIGISTQAARLSQAQAQELHQLSHLARRVRGHTPTGARSRVAGTRFNERVLDYRTRGIMIEDLARAADLTSRAVRTRLLEPLPPLPAPSETSVTGLVLVIWPAPSSSRKWRHFVEATTRRPLALPAEVVQVPVNCYLLSPTQAEDQLGWPVSETVLYPTPIGSSIS